MLKKVLIPLDGSEVAEKALDYVRELADPEGQVVLLTALDVPDYPGTMFYPAGIATYEASNEVMNEQVLPQAREYLEKVAERLQQIGYDVAVVAVIGEPALTIVEHAEHKAVDAIIMSTHGRTGISRWLFGSVALKVLGSAPCPVFVVPVKR